MFLVTQTSHSLHRERSEVKLSIQMSKLATRCTTQPSAWSGKAGQSEATSLCYVLSMCRRRCMTMTDGPACQALQVLRSPVAMQEGSQNHGQVVLMPQHLSSNPGIQPAASF